ncbi:retrovirus-related pol polyprotein from transposon 17.6 [Plakobranchus ocellatus]|uniref:Retrovirus-related pol polyprotein from transposon 17.6 n=1 Tax=Plakobranchus ocellatus TaxID=259542 RepID=A0AAV4CDI7_9GAST|nr:retrovirus-related pol polyprotein from transposon 17.6 [Plakobranchus ocellatus]
MKITPVFGAEIWKSRNRLITVLLRARTCGLKLNRAKSEFAKTELQYLGHIMTSASLRVDESKISAIKNMPSPQNKRIDEILGHDDLLDKIYSKHVTTQTTLTSTPRKRQLVSLGYKPRRCCR